MDARVAPDRPEDAVLDVVQRQRLAFDPDELGVPRTRGAEQAGERLMRVMLSTGWWRRTTATVSSLYRLIQ
jgi:hypothetical protein